MKQRTIWEYYCLYCQKSVWFETFNWRSVVVKNKVVGYVHYCCAPES